MPASRTPTPPSSSRRPARPRRFPADGELHDGAPSASGLGPRGGGVGLRGAARQNGAGYAVRFDVYGARDPIAIGLAPRTPRRPLEKDAPTFKTPAYPSFFV